MPGLLSTVRVFVMRAVAGCAAIAVSAGAAVSLGGAAPAHAISGGSPVTDSRYAFVAKIEFGERAACTGALVDPLWIVTARACFAVDGRPVTAGDPALPTTATIGRLDLGGDTGQVRTVVEVSPHGGRDLALARLSAPVAGVTPVPLSPTAAAAGGVLRAAGYGRTATEWAPRQIQGADFAVQAVDAGTVTLTGRTATGTASLCLGDAGAPLLRADDDGLRLVAVATASWQHGCLATDETREGAVGARADDLAGWLREATRRPYAIHNLVTDRCVDLPGYRIGRVGQQVYQYVCDRTSADNQLWFFDPRGRAADGQVLYSVRNATDNLCLDVPYFGAVPPGTAVSEYYCAGPEDNQFFRMVPRGAGVWLVNDRSGLCLDVAGFATGGNDAPLTLYTCLDDDDHIWKLDRADWSDPPPTQPYAIANTATGRCVDVPGFGPGRVGQQLYQYACDATAADNQLWFLRVHDLTADGQVRYSVRNVKDGLCVDARPGPDGTVTAGALVVQNECAGSDGHQLYRMVPRAGGVWFVDDRSGLCLDVAGFATGGDDAPLTLYPCRDDDDHIWAPQPGEAAAAPARQELR